MIMRTALNSSEQHNYVYNALRMDYNTFKATAYKAVMLTIQNKC